MSAYRHGLRRVVEGASIPYGYTVMVWTSGGVLIHTHGPPSAGSAFLFLGAAVLAFAAVSLVSGSDPENAEASPDRDGRWVGVWSGVAAAVGLGGAVIVAGVFESSLAFPLAALLATALYLLVSAAGLVTAGGPPARGVAPHARRPDRRGVDRRAGSSGERRGAWFDPNAPG